MLFYRFDSQEERRRVGGSCFLELQNLPAGAPPEEQPADLCRWQSNSLYAADENEFYRLYGAIFTGGRYPNGESGAVDLCGVNYYDEAARQRILTRLTLERPPEYEVLAAWLRQGEGGSGFVLLGI